MPATDPGIYSGLCLNNKGEYCAEDPDAGGLITGKDVLEEDVRQLCIHELTKVPRTTELSVKSGQIIEYAEPYWHYIQDFPGKCPLDGTAPNVFGLECSEKLQKGVGVDVDKVRECVLYSKEEKLKHERENPAWSPRALRVNGWRYSGMLEADLVTRAICAGFITQPKECQELLKPRDPFVPYNGPPVQAGVTFKLFITVLGMCMGIAFIAALLYKRSLKQSVRTTLREEVMLEVQAQMGEYRQLQA